MSTRKNHTMKLVMHVAEEMTKQYVDYMPKKIEKANDNYFDKPENNIALTITPKKRRYRHEKG